jgi:hypothetical protein
MLRTCLAALLATYLSAASLAASAAIIAQRDGTTSAVLVNQPTVIGFTTTSTFTNVSIEAKLSSGNFQDNGAGTVYLMTSVGPGTTAADEIARLSLINVPYATSSTSFSLLFSGLTLAPDTYHVVAAADAGAGGLGWIEAGIGFTEFAASGVTIGSDMAGLGMAAYPPATEDLLSGAFGLMFRVTGDPVNGIPEPSSVALFGSALALLLVTLQGKRRRWPAPRAELP